MITGTKQSKTFSAKEGKKMYYVVMVSNNPCGVCTQFDVACSFAKQMAEEKKAKRIAENVYCYEDSCGSHLIYIQSVIRVKEAK